MINQHWLDKLTDLAAIDADHGNFEDALAGLTEEIGFGGYAYLNIQPGQVLAISNYHADWQPSILNGTILEFFTLQP